MSYRELVMPDFHQVIKHIVHLHSYSSLRRQMLSFIFFLEVVLKFLEKIIFRSHKAGLLSDLACYVT